MIGSQDLLIGLAIVLVLFGAKRLPELAASLGKSLKEFKKATESGAGAEPTSAAPAPSPATASRTCGFCQSPLQTDWAHCPKCGASTAQETPRTTGT